MILQITSTGASSMLVTMMKFLIAFKGYFQEVQRHQEERSPFIYAGVVFH